MSLGLPTEGPAECLKGGFCAAALGFVLKTTVYSLKVNSKPILIQMNPVEVVNVDEAGAGEGDRQCDHQEWIYPLA